jgi:iron complex outermembrane receptor protein
VPFHRTRPMLAAALVTGAVSLGALPECLAADTEPTDTLGEIIVTVQKREQNLQDVGTSVTAFDSKSLETLGLKDVTDIAGQVPGLQFNQYGATVTVYNLRGVSQNDFSDHQEAPIAVYADDAYIANTGALAGALFDLQRVEVLRGPQGTLFGRNATGGLIQYISKQPTDTPDGYIQVTGGNYGTFQSEGAVGGPLTDDISTRAAFSTSQHAGYISNSLGPNINTERLYAGRVQFKFKLSDRGDVELKLHALNNDHEVSGNYSWASSQPDATGRGVFTPGQPDDSGYINPSTNPFDQEVGDPGHFNRTVWGSTIHFNWNFDAFSFVSVTDYMNLQKRYSEESSISPQPTFVYTTDVHYQQFSEELRLNGSVGSMRWITGAYYLNYKTSNLEGTALPDYIGNVPFPYGDGLALLGLRTSSPSIFGQLEYDFTDHWTGIVGARYTEDEKQYILNYSCNVCGPPNAATPPGGYPYAVTYSTAAGFPQAEKTDDLPTGKIELDYKFTPDVMAYGSVNRGAKGGGWSAPSSGYVNLSPTYAETTGVPVLNLRYNAETLTSYEGGVKSTFWGGAGRLNASAFYYDYRNYQGFFLDVATTVVENINARVKGAEIEFAVIPVHGLNLQLGVSELDSRALNVPTPAGDFVTAQMPQAPPWSINGVAHYEWPAFGGHLSAEVDGKWNKQQYLELINAPVDVQPSYALFNARFGYGSADGKWDVSGWVRNLADKYYRIYNLDLSGFLGFNQGVYGPPRTYGATFTYHWGK